MTYKIEVSVICMSIASQMTDKMTDSPFVGGFVFVLPTVESSEAVAAFWTAYPAQTKAKPVEL